MARRTKPRSGNLFRRSCGKHIPIDAESDATIYLSWRAHGEKRTVCLHTSDASEAEELAANIMGRVQWSNYERYLMALVQLGEDAARTLKRTTNGSVSPQLKHAWERYLQSRRRPASSEHQLTAYKGQWEAFRGWAESRASTLDRVTPEIAEDYVKHLEQRGNLSSRSANMHLQTLRRLWRVVDPDLDNVWQGLRLTASSEEAAGGERGYRPLSLIEARACHKEVLRVLGDQYADLILICYWTGMRRKDAALIKVEDVWFDDKVLRVRPPHKTRGRGRGPIYIPLFGELLRTLQRRCKGHTGEDWLLPAVAEAQTQQKNRLNKDLPATLRTKAATNKEGKVALHSFRATFITMMDLAGAPQRVTDRVTAHAPGSIRDRYSKPDIDSARTWMKRAIKPLGSTAK